MSSVFFSVTRPIQRVGSPSLLLSASRHGTFDVGERHDPMIGAYVITGGALWKGGKDSAGWLNQQQSFHVRLMLPFITWNRLSCSLLSLLSVIKMGAE